MSFKDDFADALRSVKKGFSGDAKNPDSEQPGADYAATEQLATDSIDQAAPEPMDDDGSFPVDGDDGDDGAIGADIEGDATPFASANQPAGDALVPDERAPFEHKERSPGSAPGARVDFTDSDNRVYDDSKTVISKNTVIRGSIQTDDPVRLMGQIVGDVDCKANIVVAGKVRGNTTAANAYIYNAKIDGDVRCDDVITISSDAWILGNIKAQQAEVDGKIKGNMEIRHVVSIGSQSSILGDITTDELEIKRGAFINGAVRCLNDDKQPPLGEDA